MSDTVCREFTLILKMMEQGEFVCLACTQNGISSETSFVVQWWCRKTDKIYEAKAPTLEKALVCVLSQARTDLKPWVTDEECQKTAERYKIKIYIPDPDNPFSPKAPEIANYLNTCEADILENGG